MNTQLAIQVTNHFHLHDSPSRRFLVSVDNLNIPMGSLTTILGSSGSGKSTLMNRLGLLLGAGKKNAYSNVSTFNIFEKTTDNSLVTHDIAKLVNEGPGGRSRIEALRRRMMGFFLQNGELIPTLTIMENVCVPLRLNGYSGKEATRRARDLLAFLLDTRPSEIPEKKLALECSGGEYQRIGLARAIAHQPQILFIDEPTSSLDTLNKHRVFDLLIKLVRDEDTTVVMISHDVSLARRYSDLLIQMEPSFNGWGHRIPIHFRPCDGFSRPTRFEAKINGHWVATNADFQFFNSVERKGTCLH